MGDPIKRVENPFDKIRRCGTLGPHYEGLTRIGICKNSEGKDEAKKFSVGYWGLKMQKGCRDPRSLADFDLINQTFYYTVPTRSEQTERKADKKGGGGACCTNLRCHREEAEGRRGDPMKSTGYRGLLRRSAPRNDTFRGLCNKLGETSNKGKKVKGDVPEAKKIPIPMCKGEKTSNGKRTARYVMSRKTSQEPFPSIPLFTYKRDLSWDVTCNDTTSKQMHRLEIKLFPHEFASLLDLSELTAADMCREIGASYYISYYRISPSVTSTVRNMIKHLDSLVWVDPRITATRRGEIVAALEALPGVVAWQLQNINAENGKEALNTLKKNVEVSERSLDRMWWVIIVSGLAALISGGVGLAMYMLFRGIRQDNKDMQKLMGLGEGAPKLGNFTTDLVEKQRRLLEENRLLHEIDGRDAEALQYLRMLDRPEYANPILVGRSGDGKDKIVERAAQLVADRDPRVPKRLLEANGGRGIRILGVDPTAFQARTRLVGAQSERNLLLEEAMQRGDVVYLPEMADFLAAGAHSGGKSEALGVQLKPVLTQPGSRWSGSTTPENYQRLIISDPDFADLQRRAPVMFVKPMSPDTIKQILTKRVVPKYEAHYGVTVEADAIEAAMLGMRHLYERDGLPVFDAVKQALMAGCDRARADAQASGETPTSQIVVTREHIVRGIETLLKVPIDPNAVWRPSDTSPSSPASNDQSASDADDNCRFKAELEARPGIRSFIEDLSDGEIGDLKKGIHAQWTSLSPGERNASIQEVRGSSGREFVTVKEEQIPLEWVEKGLKQRARGTFAEGVDARRVREERERDETKPRDEQPEEGEGFRRGGNGKGGRHNVADPLKK